MADSATVAPKETHPLPDTLRVATLYSPTSYFIYRETEMGYDYDLVKRFGEDKNMVIDLHIAPSLNRMVEMLDSGKVDLIACEVPITSEYTSRVTACGPESVTNQVLVQPKASNSTKPITDVTQLIGREIYVEANSKYHQRLENLNAELGGGIVIKPVDRDTLITEELIAMVSDGVIPLTVVDSDIAKINRTYFSDLDITLEISFPQRSAWGVSPRQAWLGDSINSWLHQEQPAQIQASLLKRYFEQSKEAPLMVVDFSRGIMSKLDPLFRQYARTIGWDWRLLSSMGFTESRYDSTQVSWAGARGVMQLMPATARAFGLEDSRITVNRDNIATSVKIIQALDKQFSTLVPDKEERKKFIIAAYNSGAAHILDAIALAKKHGYDPRKWIGSVEQAMMLKSKPEYYNDPVCHYGYFNGRQTFDYVHRVYDTYEEAKKKIKL
ncbi:MAG: transporter substrate-binding domain-containing protein [Bacteroides sp.]|nr:transporter substrate-binding domain-containing protein [Bacteroides sp.]